jgi:MATE family multidrug resistance protein
VIAIEQTISLKDKAKQFITILFPIFITQLSLSATSFFDTVMSGNAGRYDLAGVAIGANLWMPVYTGLNGVLLGVVPTLSQLNGAGRHKDMPFVVMQALYLAAALSICTVIAGAAIIEPLLAYMQLDPVVHRIAYKFLAALSVGFLPLFLSAVLRNFIDSLGYTHITMLITLCALPINILLNYLLIFGR